MELKKSYKGFAAWMTAFMAVSFGIAFVPVKDAGILLRLVMNVCILSVALLAFIIYKTGYVYWYNGISYEDAVKAGQERRKVYAWKHVRCFGGFALVFLVFSIIAQVCHISYWWDIVLGTVGIVGVAISTVRYKL